MPTRCSSLPPRRNNFRFDQDTSGKRAAAVTRPIAYKDGTPTIRLTGRSFSVNGGESFLSQRRTISFLLETRKRCTLPVCFTPLLDYPFSLLSALMINYADKYVGEWRREKSIWIKKRRQPTGCDAPIRPRTATTRSHRFQCLHLCTYVTVWLESRR